jgi:two-component system sensor histidine kinase BaeS
MPAAAHGTGQALPGEPGTGRPQPSITSRSITSRITARLDNLRLKLFLAIAGANAALALAAYLVFTWSFGQGVVGSLLRNDVARLDAFIVALADEYGRQGSWDWIAGDPERWSEASRNALGFPRSPRRGGADGRRPPEESPPRTRDLPPTIDFRLLLFDARQRLLLGRPDMAARAVREPIEFQGATVGYLGYVPRTRFAQSFERLYSEQQRWQFAAIALGMLSAALLLGAGLAHWLTQRIHALGRGTGLLIRGDYDVRIAARGSDELARLARDFNRLAGTLAANRRARQQWVADIAHELRTPLAVLRGEIEALQDGIRRFDAASLASLGQEVARLGRLVEDLHLLSQSDTGTLSYFREPMDPGELVEEMIEAQRRALAERGIEATIDIETHRTVLADAARLGQVLANLLQNTLRYTDAPGHLRIRLYEQQPGWLVLDWDDSAPGVAQEHLARLTDRLYRVESSRERRGDDGGAGLGLAIARAIVDAHGGDMTARQSPLGGLGWTVRLPALAPAAAPHG